MRAFSGLFPVEQNLENMADAQLYSFPSLLLISTALLVAQEQIYFVVFVLLMFPWSAQGACDLVDVTSALASVCKVVFLPAVSG